MPRRAPKTGAYWDTFDDFRYILPKSAIKNVTYGYTTY